MSLRDQYPRAISRSMQEGGYTFLKRALCMNLNSGEPTVINTGDLYLSYSFAEGHQNFMDGVTVLRGGKESEVFQRFSDVANSYDVNLGVSELESEGRLKNSGQAKERGILQRLGLRS